VVAFAAIATVGLPASALDLSFRLTNSASPRLGCTSAPSDAPARKPASGKPGASDEAPVAPSLEMLPEAGDEPSTPPPVELTQRRHPGVPSVGIWGDSHLAAGFLEDGVIEGLGLSGQAVLPRYIPPTMGRAGVRLPIAGYCKSRGWNLVPYYTQDMPRGPVGLGMASLESDGSRATLSVDFRQDGADPVLRSLVILVHALRPDATAKLDIALDGADYQSVLLRPGERQIKIAADRPFAIARIVAREGAIALDGFRPDYVEKASAYIDAFGIPGATVRPWSRMDGGALRSSGEVPAYDLVIMEYGTNEAANAQLDLEDYRIELTLAVMHFRTVFPASACVLVGPPDRGQMVRAGSSDVYHYSEVHARIAQIQAGVAGKFQCAFWDWRHAMGGEGSAYRWYYHDPQWMARDLIHLTAAGYRESGKLLVSQVRLADWARPF
jgi:hypothetical protein